MSGAKVDIHDIFAKTIVNKPSINTKRLLWFNLIFFYNLNKYEHRT